nr:MAG TPA: hypothetical protein [Crassvirales sp.]
MIIQVLKQMLIQKLISVEYQMLRLIIVEIMAKAIL